MTIDYKALAERIDELSTWVAQYSHRMTEDVADLRTVVTMLNGMAEQKPVAWRTRLDSGGYFYWDREPVQIGPALAVEPLHPQPQPQPQGEVVITKNESGQIVAVTRQDDEGRILTVIAESAPQPQREPTEAQIEARDALLDFISENGTASEGVQHYLDRYVRAALATKENNDADR